MSESIKTKDTRLFNLDGTPKNAEEPIPQTNPAEAPPIDFNTFVMSLASSVQIALGAVAHPVTHQIEENISHAKQTIDLLGLIETKANGNLTPEESGLLKHLLYQLRMQFVEESKK